MVFKKSRTFHHSRAFHRQVSLKIRGRTYDPSWLGRMIMKETFWHQFCSFYMFLPGISRIGFKINIFFFSHIMLIAWDKEYENWIVSMIHDTWVISNWPPNWWNLPMVETYCSTAQVHFSSNLVSFKIESISSNLDQDPLGFSWIWSAKRPHNTWVINKSNIINQNPSQNSWKILVGGLEHFFHMLGIIIPFDFHIFQRGRSTTNQIHRLSIDYP